MEREGGGVRELCEARVRSTVDLLVSFDILIVYLLTPFYYDASLFPEFIIQLLSLSVQVLLQ